MTSPRPFEAASIRTQSALAQAFSRLVQSAAPLPFPGPVAEILTELICKALYSCFREGSISPDYHSCWWILYKAKTAYITRRIPVVLPPLDTFVKLVEQERGRRWFDKRFRTHAPSFSASSSQLRASALTRKTLPGQVWNWSVAETLRNRLYRGEGLPAKCLELSFERDLASSGEVIATGSLPFLAGDNVNIRKRRSRVAEKRAAAISFLGWA